MWYVLAAANALSGDSDLVAGTSLKVPDTGVAKNDSSTFKPYNPNEIIGSTAPSLPYVPVQPKSGCSALATVIRVVVAVVLAVTAPYFVYAMAIAGAGEAVAQTVEIKQGYREEYNVGAIAVAAISAGYAPGGTSTWGKIGMAAVRAAGNYATSYAINRALGVEDHFSWRGVATAAVSSAIAQAAFGNLPTETAAAQNGTGSMIPSSAPFSWSRVAVAANVAVKEVGKSVIRSGISYAVEKAIVGESHWNWGQVLSSAAVQAGSAFAGTYRETGIAKSQEDSELTQSYNSINATGSRAMLPTTGYGLQHSGAIHTDEDSAGVSFVSSLKAEEDLKEIGRTTVTAKWNEKAGGWYTWNWSANNPGWNYTGQFVKGDRPIQYSRPEGRYTGQHGRADGYNNQLGRNTGQHGRAGATLKNTGLTSINWKSEGFCIAPSAVTSGDYFGAGISTISTSLDVLTNMLENSKGTSAAARGSYDAMLLASGGKSAYYLTAPLINGAAAAKTIEPFARRLPAVGSALEFTLMDKSDGGDWGHFGTGGAFSVAAYFGYSNPYVLGAGILWYATDTPLQFYSYQTKYGENSGEWNKGWRAVKNNYIDSNIEAYETRSKVSGKSIEQIRYEDHMLGY